MHNVLKKRDMTITYTWLCLHINSCPYSQTLPKLILIDIVISRPEIFNIYITVLITASHSGFSLDLRIQQSDLICRH